jgi:hypothetical protein
MFIYYSASSKCNNDEKVAGIGYGSLDCSIYPTSTKNEGTLMIKLGFDIPENICGAGLRINHFGNLAISKQAQIGMWCDIHQGCKYRRQ